MGKQIKIFIVETRLLTLRRSSDCSLDTARTQNRSNETNGAYYDAKNSVIIGEKSNGTALFRKFYSKILVYLISCVWNGKSENCAPFDHFPFFQSSPCTSFKGYVRPNRKSENGLKMINVILPSFLSYKHQ